jgi:hypothetical protein
MSSVFLNSRASSSSPQVHPVGCPYRKPNPGATSMVEFLIQLLLVARSRLKSRARLEAENVVLRQQAIVLGHESPSRVRLRNLDRLILVWMYRQFPSILNDRRDQARDRDPSAPARLSRLFGVGNPAAVVAAPESTVRFGISSDR